MSKGCPGSGLWSMQRWVQRWDVCWRLNQQASNWVWVGEVDKTEIMCSVFNKLNRVRSQGTGAFPIEPDWWSRKFYLGQHRTLGLHTQGVCFRCSSFSRECTESRKPLACETRGVGEIPGSEQKAWWLEAWEYPTAHLCKSGSWDLKRKKCGAWGSTTVHGGAGLLCFSSIQVNTKVSSVMTSGGPLLLVGISAAWIKPRGGWVSKHCSSGLPSLRNIVTALPQGMKGRCRRKTFQNSWKCQSPVFIRNSLVVSKKNQFHIIWAQYQ